MNKESLYKKKLKYNNPEDIDKVLKVFTNDPMLKISTNELKIDYKSKPLV